MRLVNLEKGTRNKLIILTAVILSLSLVLQPVKASASVHTLRITWIYCAHSDAIILQTPNNKTILVDGGYPQYGKKVVNVLQKKGVKTVDCVISTHLHNDHAGGLPEVFKAFPVNTFYYAEAPAYTTPVGKALMKAARAEGCPMNVGKRGTSFTIDDVTLRFVQTKKLYKKTKQANAGSLAVYIRYQNRTALLTADNDHRSLGGMEYHKAELMDAPHHGCKDAYIKGFYERISPKYVVVSSDGHEFHHPHTETFQRIERYNKNTLIFRTDILGTITARATDTDWVFSTAGVNVKKYSSPLKPKKK